MAIHNIYSKRQKKLRGEVSDVFTYDKLPEALKVQMLHILGDAIPTDKYPDELISAVFDANAKILCREYGKYRLVQYEHDLYDIVAFFKSTNNIDEQLDVVELLFGALNTIVRTEYDSSPQYYSNQGILHPDAAITELNERFKENAVGYSFEGGELLRIDSTYIHAEITKPTIALLWNDKFIGPNEEYMKAHEHYRHGRNKECLTECLKAFESTMKVICTEKAWAFDPARDTANKLLQICFVNDLVPSFMQAHITALRSVLESGIPTMRNKLTGHGQGVVPKTVDDEVARYGLNLTGANIIFLIEQSGIH